MPTAADIMTTNVVTVQPETPIREVAELLATKRFGSLPVVRADGSVAGIVTEEDMISRAAEIHLPRHVTFLGSVVYFENPQHFEEEAQKVLALTAADIMEHTFPTTALDATVEEIATRMLQHDLRRLLVLADGKLVGIITRADIVRMQTAEGRMPADGE